MEQLQSAMFRFSTSDVAKGLVTAIFAAIVMALGGIVSQPNFDIFTVDWSATTHLMINAGFAAFIAYLAKNFFSDQNGKFAGKIG